MGLREREGTGIGEGGIRSHCVENLLWKELCASRGQTTKWMRVYLEFDLNYFVTQNIITYCTIFSTPFLLEEPKFINVVVTDLYSPVVKPSCARPCWKSCTGLPISHWVKLLRASQSIPKGANMSVIRQPATRQPFLELKLKKCRGRLWQGTSGKLCWALLLQS